MKYLDFLNTDHEPDATDLICEFLVETDDTMEFDVAAGAVAAESSVGTWTELTTMRSYVEKLHATVYELDGSRIKVAYPVGLFEPGNMANIMSSVCGNVFGLKGLRHLKLDDIHYPKVLADSFMGPKFGIEGVRKVLKIPERPFVGTIIKPKLGLVTEDHAEVAYESWAGGCDVVKDDENLSSQSFNRFEKRLDATLKARDKAEKETGEMKVYMINVTAETNEMVRRAKLVEDAGGRYIMFDTITSGNSGFQTLREADLDLVIHAHRAGHGAFTLDPKHGVSMKVIAKNTRLMGADQLHVGTAVGKMKEGEEEVLDNIECLTSEMHGVKTAMPVASGGLYPAVVPPLLKIFGYNVVVQAGGGVHGHPDGTYKGATAMRQAIAAVMEGRTLQDYAEKHEELRKALEIWETPTESLKCGKCSI
jgi:ribulose-bisphosphate carboxylase large chain